ncbi:hypothetical protein ACFLS1_12195 [Verrucomicrobiota bacterium]
MNVIHIIEILYIITAVGALGFYLLSRDIGYIIAMFILLTVTALSFFLSLVWPLIAGAILILIIWVLGVGFFRPTSLGDCK